MGYEKWETTKFAAGVLGISERHVRRLVKRKVLEGKLLTPKMMVVSGQSLEELAEETEKRKNRKVWRKLAHYKRTPYLMEPAFVEDCGPIRSRRKPDQTDLEKPGRVKGWSYWFYVPGYGRQYAQSRGEEIIEFKSGVAYTIWGETRRGEFGALLILTGWKEWERPND